MRETVLDLGSTSFLLPQCNSEVDPKFIQFIQTIHCETQDEPVATHNYLFSCRSGEDLV